MTFAAPLFFLLAIGIVARLTYVIRDRRRSVGAFVFSSLTLVAEKTSWRARLAFLPLLLEICGLALLVVALARPQRVSYSTSDRFGIDLVVALDASGSMAAEDFRPRNRLAVARELIGAFIERRVDDRIGIVTFGSRAATRVPITFDREVARDVLEKTDVGEHGDGTAIGHAIATSVNRLRTSPSRSKVIVLVTDGVNNAGSIDPLAAADIAARLGVKIYTIGVGSKGAVPVPVKVQDRFTGEVATRYVWLRGEIDEKTLRAVAEKTKGEYFRAVDASALQDVLRRIDALEKSRLSAPREANVVELYHTPLVGGVALLFAAYIFGESVWMRLPA